MKIETENKIENDVIILTTKTVEFLLSKHPDSLILYLFFIKNSKIQKTNQIWNTDTFGMKGLCWGRDRYKEARKILESNNLIKFITDRDSGKFSKKYIKINYLFTELKKNELLNHTYQNPQAVETTGGETTTNALSNKSNALSNKKEILTLPIPRGTTPAKRLLSIYKDCFMYHYGFNYKEKGKFGSFDLKILKDLLESYSELQIARLLIIFFNWHGMTGSDTKEFNFLSGATFYLGLFKMNTSKYEAYSRNVLGEKFDDDNELLEIVGRYMMSLK